ncbi:hypothetical protein CERSUDRAFT_76810 [Gelatoporia subvermispora B]|uniref:Protein kinase domain-containing protein n=1 Tax=Ceriporiopsis subvermispora (strain B) TaxID=914234 RepID=M2R2I6_CERS8|nr:hypothetical protein CERSUDRAFT_76810 [Gelatoporia subvermispora B]
MTKEIEESSKITSRPAHDMTDPYLSQFICPFERFLWARRFERMDMTPPEPTERIEDKYLLPICTVVNAHALRLGGPTLECVAFEAKDRLYSGDLDAEWRKLYDPFPADWSEVHQAFCITAFAVRPPGTLKPEYFDPRASHYVIHLPEAINRMVEDLRTLALSYNCPFGILTDEITSVVIMARYYRTRELDSLCCQAVPVEQHPVRYLLGALIHGIGYPQGLYANGLWPTLLRRGTVPQVVPTVPDLDDAIKNRLTFQDWDHYVLQHSREEWEMFKEWKNTLLGQALLRPVTTGDILTGSGSREFASLHFTMRSPFPKLELPQETFSAVTRWSRTRSQRADQILRTCCNRATLGDFSFVVTNIRRSGDNSFSQVFYGTLDGMGREADSCESPWDSLNSAYGLEPAIEVAQKEEAVYNRMGNLQGSLIPHYYGIYLFQLPDGGRAWGLLMEVIDAPSLLEADAKSWSKDAQIDFVLRMRHAFKAFRYAGVQHGDEHPRNVLCPQIRQAPDNAPEIVLVDFGRARLWLEDSDGTPASYPGSWPLTGFGGVLEAAGIDDDILYKYWEPIQDEER